MKTNLENNQNNGVKNGDEKEMTSSYDPIYYNLVDNNKSRKGSNDTSQTQTPNNEIGYDDDPFTIFCEIDVNSSWNID